MSFTIYKSSAGSGKTYALVKEYLKLVLPNPEEFKSILAVTFTNKAAEEMRNRILNNLRKLVCGEAEELAEQLRDEGVKVNLKSQASVVLDLILHNYSYFSVCTIDSFFHKIIRSFSKELRLRLGCGIELEEDEVLDKAIDRMFADIGIDSELTKYLQQYAFYSIDEDSGWNIDRRIKQLAGEIFKERYRELRTEALADNRVKVDEVIKGLFGIIDSHDGGLKDVEEFRNYKTAEELIKTVYSLGIFRDIQQKLIAYREENNVILISDVNDLLQRIVRDNPSPFIYDKIGIRYKHFLIDEFQDTSTFQWLNLLPLIINSLGENNFSAVVGDVKQSIFRWRNGNMKLLLEQVHTDLAPFNESIKNEKLSHNYRSRANIVEFNNNFFKKSLDIFRDMLKNHDSGIIARAYSEIKQTARESKQGGYVRIKFFDYVKPNSGAQTSEDMADAELLGIIKESQAGGYPLKNITVLVRYNSQGSRVARLLASNNINVISAESLLVNSSPDIRFLISLLYWLVDRENRLAKAEALYHYYTYLTTNPSPKEKGILFQRLDNDTTLEEILGYQTNLFSVKEKLNLPLYDLIETLIGKFQLNMKGNAYLLRFLDGVLEFSVKHNAELPSFLEWWEENKAKYSIIVPDEENAVRVLTIHKAKGLENGVVIIPYTHWDIGIDWRDLMWVNSSNTPFNKSSAYFVRSVNDLEKTYFANQFSEEKVLSHLDNLNLLYVAMTRPIDRLYVIVPLRYRNSNAVSGFVKNVLTKSKELSQHYSAAENLFEFGTKSKYSGDGTSKYRKLKLNNFVSSDAITKVLLKKSPLPLKQFDRSNLDEDTVEANVFHAAMSYIGTSGDIDSCLKKLIDKGLIVESSRVAVRDLLNDVICHPEASGWFSGECVVKNEKELLLPDGTILRPDRIITKDGKTIVVDYKTGVEKEEHKKQLRQYAEVMKSAGYGEIEKYIYYIRNKKIVKVDG